MIKHLPGTIFLVLTIYTKLYGQSVITSPDYQTTMLSNPALTGTEGNGYIRLSYMNLYPGNSYNLHSVICSYDGYFPALHGGVGFFVSNDYLGGIINNLSGGFSYAYFLQAGKDLYITAGLSASFLHRGYSFSDAVMPDQIDPLRGVVIPSGEFLSSRGNNVLDLSSGFLLIAGRYLLGISVSHLAEPDVDNSEFSEGKMLRRLLVHAAGDFNISKERNLKIRPLGIFEYQDGFISGCATKGTIGTLE